MAKKLTKEHIIRKAMKVLAKWNAERWIDMKTKAVTGQ